MGGKRSWRSKATLIRIGLAIKKARSQPPDLSLCWTVGQWAGALKKQPTVALSSAEAEYIVLTLAAKQANRLRLLLTELGLLSPDQQHAQIKISDKNMCVQAINDDPDGLEPGRGDSTVSLKGENQESLALAHNPVFHTRTKHIDIQHHYIRNEVAAKRIELTYVPTAEMIADGLTKPLTHTKFHTFVEQMQMT